MKKSICCFLVLCLCVLIFTSCNKNVSEPTTKGNKVVLTVGSWPSKEGVSLNAYNEALARFNEKYGDQIEIVPDHWTFDVQTFLPKAASGQLPTLYAAYFTEADRIIDAGYAADITEYMKKYDYEDKVNDTIKNMITRDGKMYLIPRDAYAFGILANLNLLREAGLVDEEENPIMPKTYDELVEYAKLVKEKTGKAGFIMPTAGRNGGWHFTVIAWSFGVKFMEKIDGKWKATFNTPECVEALQFIKDLKWKHNVLNPNVLINLSEAQKLFATDQGAFYLASTPADNLFSNYGMNKDDIAMGTIPSGKKKHVTLMGGAFKVLAPNATEEQKDAAFKWLEYEGVTPHLTDTSRESLESKYKSRAAEGFIIGIPTFSPWNNKASVTQFEESLRQKYLNVNINHIKQYGNFDNVEIRAEEPVCCQDLYALLDACIQAVLTDENADCAELIANAARDFQVNNLDNAQ